MMDSDSSSKKTLYFKFYSILFSKIKFLNFLILCMVSIEIFSKSGYQSKNIRFLSHKSGHFVKTYKEQLGRRGESFVIFNLKSQTHAINSITFEGSAVPTLTGTAAQNFGNFQLIFNLKNCAKK